MTFQNLKKITYYLKSMKSLHKLSLNFGFILLFILFEK